MRGSTHKLSKRKSWTGFLSLRKVFTNPVLRAIFIFVVLMSLFYGFVHSPNIEGTFFYHHLRWIASITGWILSGLGYDSTVAGTTITTSQLTLRIVRGCDAIEPAAAFISAVIASPVSIRPKVAGILIGTISLLLINLVRIISLCFVGMYYPRAFTLIHESIWQAAFIILAIVFWAFWVQWATRPHHGHKDAAG